MTTWVLVIMLAHLNGGTSIDAQHTYISHAACTRAAKAVVDAPQQSEANPVVFRAAVRAVCVEGPSRRAWWSLG